MDTASIQSALDILNESHKQQFSNNVGNWNCNMDSQMFDLTKHSSIHCRMGCKVLMCEYCVFRSWMLQHTELDVDSYITSQ